jgi:hypothetical protein
MSLVVNQRSTDTKSLSGQVYFVPSKAKRLQYDGADRLPQTAPSNQPNREATPSSTVYEGVARDESRCRPELVIFGKQHAPLDQVKRHAVCRR